MDCKFIYFKEISHKIWDEELDKMEGHTHLVSSCSLNYYSNYEKIYNKSFLVEFEKKIVSIVPLAINKNTKTHIFSFNYGYCPSPVFRKNLRPSVRRKILSLIIIHIKNMNHNIKNLNFFNHPVVNLKKKFEISSKNQFEMIQYTKNYSVINTFILDLKLNIDELIENMSKYHRRNIFKSKNKMSFNIYDNKDTNTLKIKFKEFKNFHFKSAGKKTRPDSTWKIMFEKIIKGNGILFSVEAENKDISYLYCGIYEDFAWGWSQVNNKNFEKKYMPRHFLEWKAIEYFNKKKFSYYELGESFRSKEKRYTNKEISISEFKEKYGAFCYPKSSFKLKL